MSDAPGIIAPIPSPPPAPPAPPASTGFLRRQSLTLADQVRRWLRHPWRLLSVVVLLGLIGLGAGVAGLHARAFLHLRWGRSALERHHNSEALTHFQACLHTWPNDPDALLLSARACWRLKDFAQANQYLRDYQRVAGATEEWVRETYLVTAAEGDVDRVEKACQERIDRKDPAAPVILEALVNGCMKQYRLVQAAAYLQHWLELQPDDTQALLFQITMDHMRYRPNDAIARYRRVLQLDPEHQAARLRLAQTLLETRRFEEATPLLETVLRREPQNWQAVILLAQCQDQLGHAGRAEQLLDEVLSQAPHHPDALAERGHLALRRGQLEAAEKWLRHALVHAPGNFQARYNLGQCLLQRGEMAEVKKQQQRLKQLETDQKRLRQIMTQEMSQRPHDPALHKEVAMILLRSGDGEGTLYWLHSALREDPTSIPLHRALADYYQEIGNQERAAYHRQFVPPEPASPPQSGS
jgi:predicted Zn-dependent protease